MSTSISGLQTSLPYASAFGISNGSGGTHQKSSEGDGLGAVSASSDFSLSATHKKHSQIDIAISGAAAPFMTYTASGTSGTLGASAASGGQGGGLGGVGGAVDVSA
jgi:hypothetical protein